MAMSPTVRAALEEAKRKAAEKKAASGIVTAQEVGLVDAPAVGQTLIPPELYPSSMQVTPVVPEEPQVQNEQHRQILESLDGLKTLLLANDPEFVLLLEHIHKQLLQYPELVHILSDEEITSVYQGLLAKNKVHIVVKASKASSGKGKPKKLGLLDDGTSIGDLL